MRYSNICLALAVICCQFLLHSPAVEAASEEVLYSFKGSASDGAYPSANLTEKNGVLFGSTSGGGLQNCNAGCGTVFSIDAVSGTESVLHFFQDNGTDGTDPNGLLDIKGVLYGTTRSGGAYSVGAVFSLDPATGAETVLHSFGGVWNDGGLPVAGLTKLDNKLFGTTLGGGRLEQGSVFKLDVQTGAEKIIKSFGDRRYGRYPYAALLAVDGVLYGTLSEGGSGSGGQLFSLDRRNHKKKVLYSFCSQANCADGDDPESALISVNGILYGTTMRGGAGNCYNGCGTIFSFDPNIHKESVLYSFCACVKGSNPVAGLVEMNGKLYGTTPAGGNCNFCGAAFSVDLKTGSFKLLHLFGSGSDGAWPQAGLIKVRGVLYGTTFYGGTYNDGTVFTITP